MTHVENPLIWKLFFLVSGLSVTAFLVAVIGRESIWRPRDAFDKAFQNAFRVLGAAAFVSVIVFCYAVTARCVTAENECEQYREIIAAKARNVSNETVAEITVDTGECQISWLADQHAFTSLPVGRGDTSSGPLPGSIWGQRQRKDDRIQSGISGFEVGGRGVPQLPSDSRIGQRYH